MCEGQLAVDLLSGRRQVRTTPMRHLGRHANAFTQRRMRVNRLADVDGVGSHFDGQSRYADSTC